MGIFSRFTDIVNANLNALLDKAEDPEKMVRLIIQEMEDTLVEVRSLSAKALAERKDLERRIAKLAEKAHDWQAKAELALTKDREDLAKGALIEKSRAEEAMTTLQAELVHVEESIAKLSEEVAQINEKLTDARARQKSIILRKQSAQTRLDVRKRFDGSKVEDTMAKFDQYERRIDDIEAQVEAYDLGKGKSLDAEFAALAADEKVNQELDALKAKMAKKK
ncbi:phage shock protein PspA [Gallaecimonas pentaromativorans]|uniref:Phage shock protein A (PspA) family protein n=1 Tax=Gallaecimonas pentaromativorans TaxID=584787 RepID=A0A3N1PMB3_9GAMM|nr:phage shock protein PspA [Gallaecimonas pentaromativorans]MED5524085.1 phage shock protein PspA [Pseudomonadota bacterium]ROQ29845.1 phage shock protein A (PspA) family protein [Gallaecimonas pentaromativorans]